MAVDETGTGPEKIAHWSGDLSRSWQMGDDYKSISTLEAEYLAKDNQNDAKRFFFFLTWFFSDANR